MGALALGSGPFVGACWKPIADHEAACDGLLQIGGADAPMVAGPRKTVENRRWQGLPRRRGLVAGLGIMLNCA